MKKFVAIFISPIFILSSCGNPAVDSWDMRTDFVIETLKLSTNSWSYQVEKTARLTAWSTLSLPSDGIGQVEDILVKEWQVVKKGQTIVRLKDTTAMYGIQVKQASNGVSSASATREATLANLDQAVTNAEISLAQAQRNYDTLLKDIKERRKQAENDYYNANPNNTGSTAQINLEKLKIDLESAKNNYRNQISTLNASYHLYSSDFDKISSSMLFEADRILWITSTYQYANDNWEPYLGLYIGNIKSEATNKWWELYEMRGKIRSKQDGEITTDNAKSEIDTLTDAYKTARNMGISMSTMLQNSMVWWGLSQEMLNGWIAQWTWFQSSLQGSELQFTSWKNGVAGSIPSATWSKSVALMNIDSLVLQVASAERSIKTGNDSATIWYNRTLISLDDQMKAAKLSLEQAEKNFVATKRNREATAKQLGASVSSASTSLALAKANYDKLTIKAPVDGKVTKINVTIGQSISTNMPVAEMVSESPEMTVDTEADVALNIQVWDPVDIHVGEDTLTGTIIAVSRIANSNLLYTTRISVEGKTKLIGQAAKVIFTISKTSESLYGLLLPLLHINIISENEGEVFLLTRSGSELLPQRKSVKLGSIQGRSIEILETFPDSTEIIMSDVSNFDSTKQKLVVKNPTISGE